MDHGERTIILAKHQIEDIQKLADYLVFIKDGCIQEKFEKEALTDMYKRYWFSQPLECGFVPGEVERKGNSIVTNQPNEAEDYFKHAKLKWITDQSLDLDEIVTMLLIK